LHRLNHLNQKLDFVLAKKAGYGKLDKAKMGIWDTTYTRNATWLGDAFSR